MVLTERVCFAVSCLLFLGLQLALWLRVSVDEYPPALQGRERYELLPLDLGALWPPIPVLVLGLIAAIGVVQDRKRPDRHEPLVLAGLVVLVWFHVLTIRGATRVAQTGWQPASEWPWLTESWVLLGAGCALCLAGLLRIAFIPERRGAVLAASAVGMVSILAWYFHRISLSPPELQTPAYLEDLEVPRPFEFEFSPELSSGRGLSDIVLVVRSDGQWRFHEEAGGQDPFRALAERELASGNFREFEAEDGGVDRAIVTRPVVAADRRARLAAIVEPLARLHAAGFHEFHGEVRATESGFRDFIRFFVAEATLAQVKASEYVDLLQVEGDAGFVLNGLRLADRVELAAALEELDTSGVVVSVEPGASWGLALESLGLCAIHTPGPVSLRIGPR